MEKPLSEKEGGISAFGIAIAAAAGAALGVFFTSKRTAHLRKDMIEKGKCIVKRFHKNRMEMKEHIRDIFGEVNNDLERSYADIHRTVKDAVEEAKQTGQLTRERFGDIVRQAVYSVRSRIATAWNEEINGKLLSHFEKGWEEMKEEKDKKEEERDCSNDVCQMRP